MIQCFKGVLLFKDIYEFMIPNLIIITIHFPTLFSFVVMSLVVVDMLNYIEKMHNLTLALL